MRRRGKFPGRRLTVEHPGSARPDQPKPDAGDLIYHIGTRYLTPTKRPGVNVFIEQDTEQIYMHQSSGYKLQSHVLAVRDCSGDSSLHSPCFHSQPSLSGLKKVCIRSLPSSSGIMNGSDLMLSYRLTSSSRGRLPRQQRNKCKQTLPRQRGGQREK